MHIQLFCARDDALEKALWDGRYEFTRYSSVDGEPIDRVPRRRVVELLARARG